MPARVLEPTPENIARAAAALRAGDVVGMPTETVYGLAGAALDPAALAKIFSVKERPTFDPLIVHVAPGLGPLAALHLVDEGALSPAARALVARLATAFWPGPLTLVLPKTARVPDLATAGLSTVAVRMPRHPVAQALIEAAGAPLAAPSANRFGRISPTSAQDVAAELGDRIEIILDGGRCDVGVESTVIAVGKNGALTLLRPGGLAGEEIERVAGAKPRAAAQATAGAAPSPGMLTSHYAPVRPLVLLPGPLSGLRAEDFAGLPPKVALLAFSGDAEAAAVRFARVSNREAVATLSLSANGDLAEAAKNLFGALRALDASGASLIVAEPCPSERGLGFAIADRLRRASARQ